MLAITAAGCATYDGGNGNGDPFEEVNRAIFEVNMAGDKIIAKPLAHLYRTFIPPVIRTGVRNILQNLGTPIILANDILQWKGERGYVTVSRFMINTTLGLGGIMDIATELDLEAHDEDFGQTLAVWGSGEGPYLVLPILGPSNPRDTVGLVVDGFLDPLTYIAPSDALLARSVVRGLDQREQVLDVLDEIERTSLDFYATVRSLYRQRRLDLIRDGAPGPPVEVDGNGFDNGFDDIPEFDEFEDSDDFD